MFSSYELEAQAFAKKYNVKLQIFHNETEYRPYFSYDKECRYVFKCRLSRDRKSYTFQFGQSIADGSKAPTLYDVLATLVKFDVGTFENFCEEFGYEAYNDNYTGRNKKSYQIYKAVTREYKAVCRLFGNSGECYDSLTEIQ